MDVDKDEEPQLFQFVTSMRNCKAKGKYYRTGEFPPVVCLDM